MILYNMTTIIKGTSFVKVYNNLNESNIKALKNVTDHVDDIIINNNQQMFIAGYLSNPNLLKNSIEKDINQVVTYTNDIWISLQSGMDSQINSIAFDNLNNLYVCGNFLTAGNNIVNRIAKWDGNYWIPIGQGFDGNVNAIEFDSNNNLYCVGNFINAFNSDGNSIEVNRVAKWDGNSWHSLLTGVDIEVSCLAIDNNDNLYIGGSFTTAGNILVNRIAKWDGNSWLNLGSGFDNNVLSLAFDKDNNLYAAGLFEYSANIFVNSIAKWDSYTWSPIIVDNAVGLNNNVYSIDYDTINDCLYIYGTFTNAGDLNITNGLVKYKNNIWYLIGNENLINLN